MADVKRYKMTKIYLPDSKGYIVEMKENKNGDYVSYDDYASLRASHSDLLEALKDMLMIADIDDWEDSMTGRAIAYRSAKAAIAKAEGV